MPIQGPFTPTLLTNAINAPVGIAVSSDGQTLYVASDFLGGIFTLPASGGTPTTLTPTGANIDNPLFLAIKGDTAYVGDFIDGQIFSFPITPSQTSYNATLLVTAPGVGGVAVSNDGFLYWSAGLSGNTGNWIYRVSVASPSDTPTLVGTGPDAGVDGLCVSCDNSTVFVTSQFSGINTGVWSIPINHGLPQAATKITSLNIPAAIDIAIGDCPPMSLKVTQKKCDFGLVYEWCNILKWGPIPSIAVDFYRIFRNGTQIATVNANKFSYKDHDRKKGVPTQYTVTAVIVGGGEITIGSVTIQ
jgi:hypothetical protein